MFEVVKLSPDHKMKKFHLITRFHHFNILDKTRSAKVTATRFSREIRDFKIQWRDGNENVASKKWICVLSVFIAIISTHLLCQM